MSRSSHRAEAGFFGPESPELFGSVHMAHGDTVREAGVVLCYPAPQEYRMVHWSFHRLAELLSAHGFTVLRFDYFATGDSAGRSEAGTLARWTSDIHTAASHLRAVADVRRISLVGMRLGAALATRAVADGLGVRDLVLWDPVVDGTTYVLELQRADQRVRLDQPYPVPTAAAESELLGYPFTPTMRADVSAVNLLRETVARPRRLLLVAAALHAEHAALVERAHQAGIATVSEVVNDPQLYGEWSDPVETLVAHARMHATLAFLTDTRA